ncbi:MAG TPA: hypothetical protein PKM63_04725 [Panacibacter sp.]|nr:hypothetical protein [Panacibacter sp.]HNP43563.1 hypothetical protein [Panacibacter sp.]
MKRRTFLFETSLFAFSIGIAGKIRWDGKSYVGLEPTTTDILGPYYRPGAPFKTDLVQAGTNGELMHFSGTIFDKTGKTPVKDALVEIWHCNEHGVYDNTSDEYVYRAAARTGKDGKYHFRTIMPVPYSVSNTATRPAHIHMRISGTGEQDLVTQIYFKGDKHIPEDSSASDPRSLNRILDMSRNDKNEIMVAFDIILQDSYQLDAASFKKIEGLYQMSDKSMVSFYRDGDDLFAKINGQIMEAMEYRGDNSFEGGLGQTKARFVFGTDGTVKTVITYLDDNNKPVNIEGDKILKYPG